jgi:hypothetical protein
MEQFYLLEANPNPQIARNEDFADSAAHCGLSYCPLLQKILTLGLSYSESFGQMPSLVIPLERVPALQLHLHEACNGQVGRRSTNIEDRRGMRVGPMAIGGGLGTLVIVLLGLFFGIDPSAFLNTTSTETEAPSGTTAGINDETRDFVSLP